MAEQSPGGHVGPMMKLLMKLCWPEFVVFRSQKAARHLGVLLATLSCAAPALGHAGAADGEWPAYSAAGGSTKY